MSGSASRKLLAVRQLHENWNAPLHLLCEAATLKLDCLQARAAKEKWLSSHTAASMLTKLLDVFDQQMNRLAQQIDDEVCAEKRARALSVLAKTLESIAAVGARLSVTQTNEDRNVKRVEADYETAGVDPNRTAELDRQLAALVQNLS